MKILSIIPADANSEAGQPPPIELITEMQKLTAESIERGVYVDGGGLLPSRSGTRVQFDAGKTRVTDGPFAETKELIAGYAILDVNDLEEGIAEAKKLPLRCEVELRPIFDCGEGFPVQARKPGTQRYMLVLKANAELSGPPPAEILDAMTKYNNELIASGVLLDGVGLQPSAAAARVNLGTGEIKRGPFDAQGLVTGFWIIQAANKAEATEWAKRVPIPSGVIEVRPFMDSQHCSQAIHELAAAAS
jgi:hypothetical protein